MSEWKPPKTKLRFESEIDPVPTMVVIKTEFNVDYEHRDADGNPVVTPQESTKRVKLKSFTPNSNSEKFAQAVMTKSDLLPPAALPAVIKLLESLKKKMLAAEASIQMTVASPLSPAATQPTTPTSVSSTHAPTASVAAQLPKPPALAAALVLDDRNNPLASPEAEKLASTTQFPAHTQTLSSTATSTPLPGGTGRVREGAPRQAAEDEEAAPQVSVVSGAAVVPDKPGALGRKGLRKKVLKRKEQEPAHIRHLDRYLSQLYEDDLSAKVRATALLLQLVQAPQHLRAVVSHPTLATALARVLQEDRKRSTALVANVLEIFFCFSSIRELHPLLVQHKIGATTMSVVDLELRRYQAKAADDAQVHTCGLAAGEVPPPAPPQALAQTQSAVSVPSGCRLCAFLQQQERLLFVCLYVLLNLAEDVSLEARMGQRHLVRQVAAVLSHRNPDQTYLQHLHLLAVAFLKKLALVHCNVVEMHREAVPARALALLAAGLQPRAAATPGIGAVVWVATGGEQEAVLANAALRLCYNLCFHPPSRALMVAALPAIAPRITHAPTAQMATRVLYHLSTDIHTLPHVVSALMPYLPALTHTLIAAPGPSADHELVALALNLALHARAARVMALPDGAALLLARALRTQDVLLLRVVRALTAHSFAQLVLAQFVHELAAAATNVGTGSAGWGGDARLEATWLLAGTDIRGVRFGALVRQFPLQELILSHLRERRGEQLQPDVKAVGMVLLGTLVADGVAASALCTPPVVQGVCACARMALETGDTDLAVQSLFCIFRMLHHSRVRAAMVRERAVWEVCVSACGHPNECVRHYGECCADVLVEYGGAAAREDAVRARFEQYNADYMSLVRSGAVGGSPEAEEDGERWGVWGGEEGWWEEEGEADEGEDEWTGGPQQVRMLP